MNHDDTPMWDDPAESSRLRQLLRAGRTAASDYDVDGGLARHLAAVQAGATMPKWAAGLSAARTATPLFNWLVIPMVGAGAFLGAWLVARQTQAPVPSLRPATDGSALVAPATSDDLAVAPDALQPQLQHPAQRRSVLADQQLRVTQVSATERARVALSAKPIARAVAPRHLRSLDEARAATRALSEGAPSGELSPSAEATATRAAIAPTTTTSVNAATGTNIPTSSPVPTDAVPPSAAAPIVAATAEATAPAIEAHRVAAAGAARSEDDARLEREMQMLAVAQRVLGTDPARALRLARQGDREFAGSMFSAERKQVGLLALVQLGRIDEARRLGAPFLVAYPNAPWSERLRRALASGRIPAP